MPDFQANIKVEATEGASLAAIDKKLEQWKAGINSTITFNAKGLDSIVQQINKLKKTKINIGSGGIVGGGSGGGGRGGSGGGNGGGGNSNSRLSQSLTSTVRQYNALRKAELKADTNEARVLNNQIGTLRAQITNERTKLNGNQALQLGELLRQGTFSRDRTRAAIQDKAAARAQAASDRAAAKAQTERFGG